MTMNPPTRESVVCRVVSTAMQSISGDIGRLRWALHGALTTEATTWLDKLYADTARASVEFENEAGRIEYQAMLTKDAPHTEPEKDAP